MATLISRPEQIVHPAYRYLNYAFIMIDGIHYDYGAGEVPYGALFNIIVKGGKFAQNNTTVTASQLTTTVSAQASTYRIYVLDIQTVVQDCLDVDLNLLGGGGEFGDSMSEVAILGTVQGAYTDADGILQFTDAVDLLFEEKARVINATMAHDSFQFTTTPVGAYHFNLNKYTSYSIFSTFGWLPMTNKPDFSRVCRGDSEYLHYYRDYGLINFLLIKEKDGAGNVVNTNTLYLPIISETESAPVTYNRSFGVGPRNIEAKFGDPLLSNTASYEVIFALKFGDGEDDYVEFTKRTYLVECDECFCNERIRIHFLNRFGKVDVISVRKTNPKLKTKSTEFKKSLAIPHTLKDYGKRKQSVEVETTYEYFTEQLSPQEKVFMEEFVSSPLHWVERTANYFAAILTPTSSTSGNVSKEGYMPVVIEDATFEFDKDENDVLKFNISLANETPIQRT